ncbi:MAG TPA: peptidoglycan DD-metalloendopeptidase family protein [Rhodospirillales bacterium]|jgi:septal ring factor EnvC (AmiA/AmiB activator)|nr:peptidoglycan DD-metalloendopeptidase family protein [Rhodospirillales bacterium]
MRQFHFLYLQLPGLLAAAWLIFPPPLAWAAQEPSNTGQRLDEVKRALGKSRKTDKALKRKSAALAKDLQQLRRQLIAAAKVIQTHEAEVTRLEDRLDVLALSEKTKSNRLKQQRNQFVHVFMALSRLARNPPEAMMAQPLSPSDMVRSAILLRGALPGIERNASRLRDELAGLLDARGEIDRRRTELDDAVEKRKRQRTLLKRLSAEKTKFKRQTDTKSQQTANRIRALAKKANSLHDLLSRLQKAKRKRAIGKAARGKAKGGTAVGKVPVPSTAGPISRLRGTLPFPAVGRLAGLYGQDIGNGVSRKGITIETISRAQVIATYDGQVVFAGTFRGYGQLLIIEHGEGYHSLLAGLARIDSVIGQMVVAGEPVGIMGRPAGARPVLYLELRRNGQPINPLPWLAARKNRISG